MTTVKPFISVVVPAYNEEFALGATISALKAQNYGGDYEIIVVNNASTDNTPLIAEKSGCRVVNQPRKGYVHALSAGFAAAHGDIIACTDADTLVKPDWIERMAGVLSRPGVVACGGVFEFSDGSRTIRLLGHIFGRLNYHIAGANMAIWKNAFNQVGGFRPDAINMGADVELGLRLRKIGKVIIDRRNVVYTSARRFQMAFWRTVFSYYTNDIALYLFHKPIFYTFSDLRLGARLAATKPLLKIAFPLVIVLFFFLIAQYQTALRAGTVFAHGGNVPVVALTFDDGPSQYTAKVLDILKQHGIKATFFVIGKNVERNPATARRIVAEGHAIGNHTYTHPFFTAIKTKKQIAWEINKTEEIIKAATGVQTSLFRPPHGWRTPAMLDIDKSENFTMVMWNVDPRDWQHISAAAITRQVLEKTRPGSIVLLHDGLELRPLPRMENTVKALPAIIDDLEKRGYRFVTIPELMDITNQAPVPSVAVNEQAQQTQAEIAR